MPEQDKTYRIIQWMTGDVGRVRVRHFAQCPMFDLGLVRPRGLVRG